jgi:hypothetical protein
MKIITDHKCGSSVSYVLKEFLKKQNREVELCNFYLFNVSKYDPKEKYLLVVRNPREVIVSGMLYMQVGKDFFQIEIKRNIKSI